MVVVIRVFYFVLNVINNVECCNSELVNLWYLLNFLSMRDYVRNVFIVFLLNFCKLKNYMEEEMKLLKDDSI